MTVMEGLAATMQSRQLPGYEKTPILALTANAFEEDRKACQAAGMNDHIAKPIDPDLLYAVLLRWLPEFAVAPQSSLHHDEITPTVQSQLEALEGLDVPAGLRVCNGKIELYLALLEMFIESPLIPELCNALAKQDFSSALRAAHTLKGSAATLGASSLQRAAVEVEEALRAGDVADKALQHKISSQADQIAAIYDVLRGKLALILNRTEQSVDPAATRTASEAEIREILAELEALLSTGDYAAKPCWQSSKAVLRGVLGDRAAVISRLIEEFDFDEALTVLRETMAERTAGT